jgi:hypothetical protein
MQYKRLVHDEVSDMLGTLYDKIIKLENRHILIWIVTYVI